MKSRPPDPSRRAFVRQACCAAVGTTGLLSTLAQLRVLGAIAADSSDLRNTAAAVPGDFKALVCLYLQGGNDATNLIIPSDPSGYAAYAKARAELAVAQSSLLPVTAKKYSDGRSWALHPSVPEIQGLFAQGKMAVLANVGTLVQPTTLSQYNVGAGLPPQLFAHNDQSLQWQSSVPDRPFETGWGGRLADVVNAFNTNNHISMSISLSGTNSFQRGKSVTSFALEPRGVVNLTVPGGPPGVFDAQNNGIHKISASAQSNLLAAAFGGVTQNALSDSELLGKVLQAAPALKSAFPDTQTASRLSMVAKLISVSQALGLKRQIFFVLLNGWDLHAGQLGTHDRLLAEISAALKAFYDATVELGVANQVTTFTASDFGRTYVPNAGGTDHGWGNHQLIMGGAVQGADIYGTMPSLSVGANDDTGRGRWIPSTSVDEYSATLATWFGVSASNLSTVLPNINRFAKPNLGFMG